MRYLLLMIAVVALVGCGDGGKKAAAEAKAVAEAQAAAEAKVVAEAKAAAEAKLIKDPIVEHAIRFALKKRTGELTTADLEKVTKLNLSGITTAVFNQLTEIPKGLEKLTQLTFLSLEYNQLTDVKGLEKLAKLKELLLVGNKLTEVKGLEKLTQLKELNLRGNYDLTKAQIAELKKALPFCDILHGR